MPRGRPKKHIKGEKMLFGKKKKDNIEEINSETIETSPEDDKKAEEKPTNPEIDAYGKEFQEDCGELNISSHFIMPLLFANFVELKRSNKNLKEIKVAIDEMHETIKKAI